MQVHLCVHWRSFLFHCAVPKSALSTCVCVRERMNKESQLGFTCGVLLLLLLHCCLACRHSFDNLCLAWVLGAATFASWVFPATARSFLRRLSCLLFLQCLCITADVHARKTETKNKSGRG